MRLLLVIALLLSPAFALAQTSAAPPHSEESSWLQVQDLQPGKSIQVKTRMGSFKCKLVTVDADSLVCTRRGKDATFRRASIQSIRLTHWGRSTLLGAAIGGAVGAIFGFSTASDSRNSFFGPDFQRAEVTGVASAIGGAAGAVIGSETDFTHSTVYKAP